MSKHFTKWGGGVQNSTQTGQVMFTRFFWVAKA